jgi:AraC-like DNA-binding protein
MKKYLQDIRTEEIRERKDLILNDKFSLSMRLFIKDTTWIKTGEPYLYNFTHFIHIVSGEAKYKINLRHYIFRQGDIAIIAKNSILEMISFTNDYSIQLVSLKDDDKPPYCLHVSDDGHVHQMAERYFMALADSLSRGFDDTIIGHLTEALRGEILRSYRIQVTEEHGTANTRSADIFNRFLSLVSQYSDSERTISFYADKLFLSPRYLATIIKDVSGRSLMSWVNASVINKAKIALQYTDKSILEISEDLHFNEQTTFTRFFKHLTGMTPSQYRKKKF